MVDTTALNTSLNVIAQAFDTNPINMKLALTSYLLTLGTLMPLNALLVAKLGEKRLFISANIVFFLGSLGCGLSNGLLSLILFRILQGVGGAFLAPIARLIIIQSYDKDNLHKGFGVIATVISLGLVCEPVVGGVVSTHISWRYIFFINLPLIMVIIIGINHLLSHEEISRKSVAFDWLGFIAFACCLSSALLFFESVLDPQIMSGFKLALIVIMLVASVSYYRRTKSVATPVFPRQLWQENGFCYGLATVTLWRLGAATVSFFIATLFTDLSSLHSSPSRLLYG